MALAAMDLIGGELFFAPHCNDAEFDCNDKHMPPAPPVLQFQTIAMLNNFFAILTY